jgi:two-component system, chemotaxis family, chemotaxis protein CheY
MKKTVLVADDFKSIRNFICNMLESKGYRTVGASDGNEAFQMLLMNPGKIDLVLTDYNMPDCTGLDLLKMIKTHPQIAKIPVVFLTTEGDPEKVRKAKASGLSEWIKKPYQNDVFFTKIENIISNNPISQ